jgi:hypothetical protein
MMDSSRFSRRGAVCIVAAFVVGLLCGAGGVLWIKRADTGAVAAPGASTTQPVRRGSGVQPDRTPRSGAGGFARVAGSKSGTTVDEAVESLRGIFGMSDVAARNDALRELLSSVPPERFPALLQRFSEFIEKQEFEDGSAA